MNSQKISLDFKCGWRDIMWNHIYLHVIKCSKILKFRVELLLRSLFKIFRNVKKKKVCLFFLLTVVKRPIGQSFLDNVKRSHVLPVVPGELIIFRSGVSNQFLLEWFSDDLEKWFHFVSFRYLFISQWMKRSKHGLFVFPPKKTLIWRRYCPIGQSCCSMMSKGSIGWFLESSRAWSSFTRTFA